MNFTFQGNLGGDTLQLAFDNANLAQCAHTGITNGVIPAGDYSASNSNTTVTCDVTERTTAATSLQATVTNN